MISCDFFRKQRRLLRILTRLDRQLSPTPPTAPSLSQDDHQTAPSSIGGNVDPDPAPPPSWLRSKSIDTQGFSSKPIFDDLDTTLEHRTTSARNSGVRSQSFMQDEDTFSKSQPNLIANSTSDRIDDIIGNSLPDSETSKSQPSFRATSRPVSGRRSGIRGGEASRASSGGPTSRSGSSSGRRSGIRGELYSRQRSRLYSKSPLSSASDSHLPTFLDDGEKDRVREGSTTRVVNCDESAERLKTAVLAKGRRTLRLSASGSDTCLVPYVGNDDDDDVLATPTLSCAEPGLSSTHFDVDHPRPPNLERQSVNECLESVSKFDQLHLGQMTSNIQGTVI